MLNPFEETKGVKIVSEESTVHYISEPANSAQYSVCFFFNSEILCVCVTRSFMWVHV